VKTINLLCAANKVFVTYHAQCGVFTPPPLAYAPVSMQYKWMFTSILLPWITEKRWKRSAVGWFPENVKKTWCFRLDVHKTLYPFNTTKKMPHCYGNSHKNAFCCWQPYSQVCYDDFAKSAGFQNRVASLRNKNCKRLVFRLKRSITLSKKTCLPLIFFMGKAHHR